MRKKDKYGNSKLDDFFNYSEGKLAGKEAHDFERRLQKDPFEADAAEGFSRLSREETQADLDQLRSALRQKRKSPGRTAWLSIAAALISVLTVTTLFLKSDETGENKYQPASESEHVANEKSEEYTAPSESHLNIDESGSKKESETGEIIGESQTTTSEEEKNDRTKEKKMLPTAAPEKTAAQLQKKPDQESPSLAAEEVDEAAEIQRPELDEIYVEAPTAANLPEQQDFQLTEQEVLNNKATRQVLADKSEGPKYVSGIAEGGSISPTLYTRKISGTIRSADDLMPLPDVHIQVKGSSIETVTDKYGRFNIAMNDNKVMPVVISKEGMIAEEFMPENDQSMELTLMPEKPLLSEVLVMAPASSPDTLSTISVTRYELGSEAAEYLAMPTGGINDFKDYINEALIYPDTILDKSKAVVVLKFTIDENGNPDNFSVIRSPGEAFSKEAIRVIKEGPLWIPASKNDSYSDEAVRLRVVFKEN